MVRSKYQLCTGDLALAQQLFHTGADGNRRHARRRADGLLRAAETDVDSLPVDVKGHSAQTRHRIHDQQRAQFIGDLAKLVDLGDHSRGSLALTYADEFDLAAFAGPAHVLGIHGASERRFDPVDGDAVNARGYISHALGKFAVDANDGFVARFERVAHGRLDAARTAGGKRQRHTVLGLEKLAKEHLHFADHFDKPRVHMTHQRGRERAINPRVQSRRALASTSTVTGPKAHQNFALSCQSLKESVDLLFTAGGVSLPQNPRQRRQQTNSQSHPTRCTIVSPNLGVLATNKVARVTKNIRHRKHLCTGSAAQNIHWSAAPTHSTFDSRATSAGDSRRLAAPALK